MHWSSVFLMLIVSMFEFYGSRVQSLDSSVSGASRIDRLCKDENEEKNEESWWWLINEDMDKAEESEGPSVSKWVHQGLSRSRQRKPLWQHFKKYSTNATDLRRHFSYQRKPLWQHFKTQREMQPMLEMWRNVVRNAQQMQPIFSEKTFVTTLLDTVVRNAQQMQPIFSEKTFVTKLQDTLCGEKCPNKCNHMKTIFSVSKWVHQGLSRSTQKNLWDNTPRHSKKCNQFEKTFFF